MRGWNRLRIVNRRSLLLDYGGKKMGEGSTFKVTGMDLSGYMVKEAPRAIGFYRDVLGLGIENPKTSAMASCTAMLAARLCCSTNLDVSVSTMTMIPTMM